MVKFKINKRARFNSSMLAGACIIGLAVWGWGLPVSAVVSFFLISFGGLLAIVSLAAGCGWLLKKLRGDH